MTEVRNFVPNPALRGGQVSASIAAIDMEEVALSASASAAVKRRREIFARDKSELGERVARGFRNERDFGDLIVVYRNPAKEKPVRD